tara:strand:+ start:241 stop:429 length:189 start_codon:yes stop_codon:yes gene_type:complete
MMMSKPEDDVMDVVMGLFEQKGIRHPDSFSAEEIIEHCPNVPEWFTRQHVEERDARKKRGGK